MPQNDVANIVKAEGSRLRSFIRRRVASREDAEDILQDVWYQLARMDSLSRPIENVAAWLFRVARNLIINWQTKKRDEPMPATDTDEDGVVMSDVFDFLLDNNTPETEYLRAMVWDELEAALAELPPEQREIFELTELDGLPVKEIAETTGVPVNTLLSRKHYAVMHLRKRLAEIYDCLMV